MRQINDKAENPWREVEKSLEENTASGYKMACIEAEKVFCELLKSKKYPIDNLEQVISLFGWKLTNKQALKEAISKTEKIKSSFDYKLSSFEAEDIVEVYKQAIADFSDAKTINWQRKMTLFFDNYVSFKSSFLKKFILLFLVFFLAIKFLAHTQLGQSIVMNLVKISDFIYSWFLLFIVLALGIFIFVITVLVSMDRSKTRIKSIKEK